MRLPCQAGIEHTRNARLTVFIAGIRCSHHVTPRLAPTARRPSYPPPPNTQYRRGILMRTARRAGDACSSTAAKYPSKSRYSRLRPSRVPVGMTVPSPVHRPHNLRHVVPRAVGQCAHPPELERPRVRRLDALSRRLGIPGAGYSMTGIFASQSSFEPPTSRMN